MKQGWEIKKLGEVCEILDHLRVPITKKDRREGCYPYYGASGVQDYIDSYIFDGRYLLVGEDGAKWGPNDKSAYIIEGKSWVNNHAHILKINDCLSDKLVEYYLVAKDLQEFITGAIVPKLTQQALRNIPIPVPPLPVQEQIVSELDLLSGIIEKKREQLKELDALAQSIFYDMFGDPITNEKGWEVKKLGEVCEVTSFKRVLIEEVVETGIPFIRGTELTALSKLPNSKDYPFTLFITKEHYERVKAISGVPTIGDLLIPSINSEGLIWELDTDEPRYYKDGRVLWVHTNHKYNYSKALKYILSNKLRMMYNELASGATFIELKLFVLRDIELPFPPLHLQHQFASKIEAIERQKELIKQSISETETLFNARMQEYFG